MKSIVLCNSANPELALPYYERYGFGTEIQQFLDIMDNTDEMIEKYNNTLPDNIEKYMHAPYNDLCLGSKNKRIAEVTRLYFDYACDVAEKLGCKGVIVHHGYVPHTSYPAAWIERAVVFWNDFFSVHQSGINVFMENQFEHSPDMLIEIIDRCNDSRLKINLDVGHAHAFGKVPITQWIEKLNKRIAYVHLHQNYGENDEHLGLRKGNMKIHEVLSALEYHAPDAVWALECDWGDMDESISLLSELRYAVG